MGRTILILITSLLLSCLTSANAQTTLNAEAENISKEIARIAREKDLLEKRRIGKRQKQSTKNRIKKLKHMSDSAACADYMIELSEVAAYADNWPSYIVYPTLKEAKKAFSEPYFSGGYLRTRFNLKRAFKQPENIDSYFSMGEWGYATVKFLVDKDGKIVRAKAKTRTNPEVDEKLELAVLGLPVLNPAEFGGKKYPSVGTMVVEYEIGHAGDGFRKKLQRKGIDIGERGDFFMYLIDYNISWSPAITPVL